MDNFAAHATIEQPRYNGSMPVCIIQTIVVYGSGGP